MATENTLLKIKKSIEPYVGKRVKIKANRGRKKIFEQEGILEKVYPSIFVVRVEEAPDSVRRVSYSYSDILTETVQLTPCCFKEKTAN